MHLWKRHSSWFPTTHNLYRHDKTQVSDNCPAPVFFVSFFFFSAVYLHGKQEILKENAGKVWNGMGRKLLRKYLILAGVLLLFAGVMWLSGRNREVHQENAVLAGIEKSIDLPGRNNIRNEVIGRIEGVASV